MVPRDFVVEEASADASELRIAVRSDHDSVAALGYELDERIGGVRARELVVMADEVVEDVNRRRNSGQGAFSAVGYRLCDVPHGMRCCS
jgi:hypothetical protein